jgi:hypothetical protein
VDAGINGATHLGGQRCGDHEDRDDSTNYRKLAEHKIGPQQGSIVTAMAATNKCLAQTNKSRAGAKRLRAERPMDSAMTLQEAKSIARHLGLTLRQVRSSDYRVNFCDGNKMTAHYTDNLEDAVIRKRTEPSSSTHVL